MSTEKSGSCRQATSSAWMRRSPVSWVGRNLEAVALYESVVSRLRRSPEAAEAHRAAVDNLALARRRLLRKTAPHARVTSGRRNLRTIWIVGVVTAALGIASLVSFTAYQSLPLHSARWLVEPVLYLGHREHAVGLVSRILFLPTEIVLGVLLISMARRWSWWVGIATGVGLGGALANTTQAAMFGSVTDFVGIRAVGLLSVGDICICAGLLVVATIWAARPAAVGGIGRRYLFVVLGALLAWSVIEGNRFRLGLAVLAWSSSLFAALIAYLVSHPAIAGTASSRNPARPASGPMT